MGCKFSEMYVFVCFSQACRHCFKLTMSYVFDNVKFIALQQCSARERIYWQHMMGLLRETSRRERVHNVVINSEGQKKSAFRWNNLTVGTLLWHCIRKGVENYRSLNTPFTRIWFENLLAQFICQCVGQPIWITALLWDKACSRAPVSLREAKRGRTTRWRSRGRFSWKKKMECFQANAFRAMRSRQMRRRK